MPNHADRDLLHGLIALQNHFIDQSDLLAAFHAWSDDRSKPLVQILRDRGALSDDDARFLEALVSRHLLKFGGGAARSLAALSSIGSARQAFERTNDPEIQASLALVSIARDADGDATRVQSPSDVLHIPASRFRVLRFHAKGGLGAVGAGEPDRRRVPERPGRTPLQPRLCPGPQGRRDGGGEDRQIVCGSGDGIPPPRRCRGMVGLETCGRG
jgi:hypothetical protein